MQNEIYEHIAQYFAERESGELNQQLKATIDAWLNASEENKTEFEKLEKSWSVAQQQPIKRPDVALAWDKVHQRIEEKAIAKEVKLSIKEPIIWGRYAAAISLLLAATALWLFIQSDMWFKLNNQQIITKAGEQKNITLADGTKVLLNGESVLYFPEKFNGNSRKVMLEGEGFFEVAHRAEQPFTIAAGETTTTVLGTTFNLRHYGNEQFTEVFLQEGKVAFASGKNETILDPGEVAIYSKAENNLSKVINKNSNITAWKTGSIKFKETTINEVLNTLSRYYRTTITVEEGFKTDCVYTGTFNDLPLEEVFDLIQFSSNFTFKKVNDNYLITGDLCPEE